MEKDTIIVEMTPFLFEDGKTYYFDIKIIIVAICKKIIKPNNHSLKSPNFIIIQLF